MNATHSGPRPVVHLELHTGDQVAAGAFYARLLGWQPEPIETLSGSYLALGLGGGVDGGIVECGVRRPLWLPYVEVDQMEEYTARARRLGARVCLEPREGPAGWRSVVSTPEAGGSRRDRVLAAEAMTRSRESDAATTGTGSPRDGELLHAARSGDQDAFCTLVEPYRRELQAHCYRMLGSYADAEDALQETLLRAWRGLARFEGRSSLRSWLYRIATNTCLRAIERRPKGVLPIDYAPAADPHDGPADRVSDPVWLEPYPDTDLGLEGPAGPEARYEQREAVELAFIAALQHLPARQRAVLILRDVLGFSARETADVLETTPVSVDSALQRAHKAVDDRLPSQSQQQTLRLLGDEELGRLVERYVAAWERNDIDAVVSMLAEDARIVMPPLRSWYSGRGQVGAFLSRNPLRGDRRWRMVPTSANGQPAFGTYVWNEQTGAFTPHSVSVLTLRGGQIEEIMVFLNPESLEPFGLPASLPA